MDENDSPPPEDVGGISRGKDPPLKAEAFFPLLRGNFRGLTAQHELCSLALADSRDGGRRLKVRAL
jgi:hypothetical protein